MTTRNDLYLADGTVLIALATDGHVHHERAMAWFTGAQPTLATCPITQATLLRFLIREGLAPADAAAVLDGMADQPWHRFWPDDLPYTAAHLTAVLGHRQVTDAYLAALARHHGARVATLDRGFAAVHPDVATLLPT